MRDRGEGVVANLGRSPATTRRAGGIGHFGTRRVRAAVEQLRRQHRVKEPIARRQGQADVLQESEIEPQVVPDDDGF